MDILQVNYFPLMLKQKYKINILKNAFFFHYILIKFLFKMKINKHFSIH